MTFANLHDHFLPPSGPHSLIKNPNEVRDDQERMLEAVGYSGGRTLEVYGLTFPRGLCGCRNILRLDNGAIAACDCEGNSKYVEYPRGHDWAR